MIDNSNDTFYEKNATAETTWVDFQFLKQKIDLSSYQIKTYIYGSGNPHPKEWEILGSNDREHWDVLDHQENCSELNQAHTTEHFVCQTPTHKLYQYIRYHQISNWHTNQDAYKYSLRISKFELYGDESTNSIVPCLY